MDLMIVSLRLIHILFGVLWVGIVVFMAKFLTPSLQEAGPDGAKVMAGLQRRRLMTVVPVLALITILSGLWLYWRASLGFDPAYVHSRIGMTFALGGLVSIAGYVLGLTVMRPAMLRAMALSQQLASTPESERGSRMEEIQRLRARGAAAGRVVAILLIIATAAMAVARYI